LDQDVKPWLLEVNHTPSFATDSILDKTIKKNLITDTLYLVYRSHPHEKCVGGLFGIFPSKSEEFNRFIHCLLASSKEIDFHQLYGRYCRRKSHKSLIESTAESMGLESSKGSESQKGKDRSSLLASPSIKSDSVNSHDKSIHAKMQDAKKSPRNFSFSQVPGLQKFLNQKRNRFAQDANGDHIRGISPPFQVYNPAIPNHVHTPSQNLFSSTSSSKGKDLSMNEQSISSPDPPKQRLPERKSPEIKFNIPEDHLSLEFFEILGNKNIPEKEPEKEPFVLSKPRGFLKRMGRDLLNSTNQGPIEDFGPTGRLSILRSRVGDRDLLRKAYSPYSRLISNETSHISEQGKLSPHSKYNAESICSNQSAAMRSFDFNKIEETQSQRKNEYRYIVKTKGGNLQPIKERQTALFRVNIGEGSSRQPREAPKIFEIHEYMDSAKSNAGIYEDIFRKIQSKFLSKTPESIEQPSSDLEE
jgi:Tubulin-tyrosine ligase family